MKLVHPARAARRPRRAFATSERTLFPTRQREPVDQRLDPTPDSGKLAPAGEAPFGGPVGHLATDRTLPHPSLAVDPSKESSNRG